MNKKFSYIIMSIFFISIILMMNAVNLSTYNQINEKDTFTYNIIYDSALTRTSPITITSDGDWVTYADSGSGSISDPWIIEDRLIECNNSGSGIIVQNTNDYAIFDNININETGGGATDGGIFLSNADNIVINNSLIYECPITGIGILGDNIIINNTISRNNGYNIYISNANDILIKNSEIFDHLYSSIYIQPIYGTCDNINVTNCIINGTTKCIDIDANALSNAIFDNLTIRSSARCFEISDSVNITIKNCDLLSVNENINFDSSINFLVQNNSHVTNDSTDPIICVDSEGWINNCTFNQSDTDIHAIKGTTSEINVSYCNFIKITELLYTTIDSTNCNWTFTRNFILLHTRFIASANLNDNITFQENYYKSYFDIYPYAIPINTTTDILNTPIFVTGATGFSGYGYYDNSPAYYSDWYLQEREIFIQFYSNYDLFGINFGDVKTYEGFNDEISQISTDTPTINTLLYRIVVKDFANIILHDGVYNHNQTMNLYIGMNLAETEFQNTGESTSWVFIQRNNITSSFPVGPGQTKILRMSDGDYILWVEDSEGNLQKDEKDIEINNGGYFDVGWLYVEREEPEIVPVLNLLDYLAIFGFLVGIVAIIGISIGISSRKQSTKKNIIY